MQGVHLMPASPLVTLHADSSSPLACSSHKPKLTVKSAGPAETLGSDETIDTDKEITTAYRLSYLLKST